MDQEPPAMEAGRPRPRPSWWRQVVATVQRNVTIKRRQKRRTIAEILMPVYIFAILALVRAVQPETSYAPVLSEHGSALATGPAAAAPALQLHIAPDGEPQRSLGDRLAQRLNTSVTYHRSEAELERAAAGGLPSAGLLAGLLLPGHPGELGYTIRTDPRLPLPAGPGTGVGQCRGEGRDGGLQDVIGCITNGYFFSGFLQLQSHVDALLIEDHVNQPVPVTNLTLLNGPKPQETSDSTDFLRVFVPLYMAISLSQFIAYLLTLIVGEKEAKIKDGLRLMGLRDSVYWFSWFIVYAVYVFVVASLCVAIMVLSKLFPYSNNGYIFVAFILYGWSLVMFGFMLTPFFTKAKVAGGVGNLAVTAVSLLFLLQVYLEGMPAGVMWLMALLSPVAFTLGIDRAVDFDTRKIGLHGFNIWDASGGVPFGGCIIMLCVDIALYAFLAFYLDNVLPNEYGRRESVFFIFRKSYWFGPNKSLLLSDVDSEQGCASDGQDPSPDVEPVTKQVHQTLALRVAALSKQFGAGKKKVVALDDLSLDMYESQITAILGHNGAGKTTFFNLLTGLMTPSAGGATIYGLDITDPGDLRELWGMIGLCPQQDILVEDLTPREHLRFIATLRGISPTRLEAEVTSTLSEVDLSEKADQPVRGLSGGQKRKLSVGQALVGDPRVVILDEPTAGVDPFSRRRLWTLLQRRKQGRIMLLTTHFMDEADILADRKAIVSAGKLRCCGSSMFLKSRFGLGYHLTLVQGSDPCAEAVDAVIGSHIPGRERGRAHGNELAFVLPMDSVGQFPELFADLEKRQQALGVQSFGVSLTTLEEVFLQLAEAESSADSARSEPLSAATRSVLEQRAALGSGQHRAAPAAAASSPPPLSVRPSRRRALSALIRIRLLTLIRVPATLLFTLLIPAVLMVAGLLISGGSGSSGAGPAAVSLQPGLYPGYRLLYHPEPGTALSPAVLAGWGLPSEQYGGEYRAVLNSSVLAGLNISSAGQAAAVLRDQAAHSPALVLNALDNGRLSELLGSRFNSSASLSVTSHPLPRGGQAQFDSSAVFSSIMVGFLFLLLPGNTAADLVQERELKIRNQLRVNGLDFTTYFLSFFAVMFGIFFTLWLVMLIVVQAASVAPLQPAPAFSMLAALYLEYTVVGLLFASVVSYLFDKLETTMSVYPNLAIMGGMLPYMLVSLLDNLLPSSGAALPLHYAFCALDPFYVPCGALYFLSKTYVVATLLEGRAVTASDYWAAPEFLTPLLLQLLQIPLLWLLLRRLDAAKNAGVALKGLGWLRTQSPREPALELGSDGDAALTEDEDVTAERARVERVMARDWAGPVPVVAAQNLSKMYRCGGQAGGKAGPLRAVSDVSFAVDAGEVLGLLGPNGAGKTTCMKLVTAEEAPSAGQIRVAGTPVTDSLCRAFRLVGYCPQFDALWKNITVQEHLSCFAQIRGVAPEDCQRASEHYIEGLQISEHARKRSHACSGGTKRKLSYALSMLGEPRIVLLDEPSTGMDPQSKRFLWDTIAAGFRAERGAILTTHSMEEADALCTRIGIMVRGNLRCLGSTQHLKNKYGGGYVLEMKLVAGEDLSERTDEARRLVTELFPTAALEESYAERLRYRIPQRDVGSLARGFSQLEEAKRRLRLEEYSLSQTTLEQVFLRFAREQELGE